MKQVVYEVAEWKGVPESFLFEVWNMRNEGFIAEDSIPESKIKLFEKMEDSGIVFLDYDGVCSEDYFGYCLTDYGKRLLGTIFQRFYEAQPGVKTLF